MLNLKKIYIYCIYFPASNKYYVGQTAYLEKRMFSHLNSKRLVGNALRKYDDWTVEILHTTKDRDAANLLEIEEIKHYNSVVPNGYNITRGGDGCDTFTNNPNKEKIRRKFSESHQGKESGAKGYKWTKEQIENNRKAQLGKKLSEKTKEKIRGYKHTKEAKEKIKQAGRRPCSKETKEKIRQGNLGLKRFYVSKRNKENNPMKDPKAKLKWKISMLKNSIKKLEKVGD